MTHPPFSGVPAALHDALVRRGFEGLTKVQRAVLSEESGSADLRISSETGSGKTVAMGLALARQLGSSAGQERAGPEALIITPTRELASQVSGELGWLFADMRGFEPTVVTGGTDVGRERRTLSRRPRILVGTPGRVLDHLRSGALDCSSLAVVVLDEADQMLEMGFKDELDAIVERLPEKRRSILMSATFPPQVLALANRFQKEPVHLQGTDLGAANADIEHIAHVVRSGERYRTLANVLLLAHGTRCLIFVRRRIDATDLAEMLAADGFSALPLSGDLAQAQRTRTLEAFRRGVVKTLVATDVAARGIDVADISTVVHFDPPGDPEAYTHRSGRTGRAGQKGRSVLLVPAAAERRVRAILHAARIEAQWQPPPTAAKVNKAVVKAARRALHTRLTEGTEPAVAEREYAEKLLEGRDPAHVVATLLSMATPELPREPFEIETRRLEGRGRERDGRGPGRPGDSESRGRRPGGKAPYHPKKRGVGPGARSRSSTDAAPWRSTTKATGGTPRRKEPGKGSGGVQRHKGRGKGPR